MSFKINEAELTLLLESQEGSLGQLIARKGDEVRDVARDDQHAGKIMHRFPTVLGDIKSVVTSDDGLKATIGIVDGGNAARYLAEKEMNPKEGQSPWLRSALAEVFPG